MLALGACTNTKRSWPDGAVTAGSNGNDGAVGNGGSGGTGATSFDGPTSLDGAIPSGDTGSSGGTTGFGGSAGTGGVTGLGGASQAGSATGLGGTTGLGGLGGATGTGGSTSAGGATVPRTGPCDIYAAHHTPCVAAYSMVRVLSQTYAGPLFQVRAGSSSTNNTMSGGTTRDIMPGPDGFVEADTVDAACGATYCTVSVLYDHSGSGNHLQRAFKGLSYGTVTYDSYESVATQGMVMAGGHRVYSLYMNKLEGYRTPKGVVGKNVPTGSEPQGIYELADGTRSATACCWDFGNAAVSPDQYGSDALFFGAAYWGRGSGKGPWYMADFEAGVFAGGTKVGDPGYGDVAAVGPPNPDNPSLMVPFAIGFLKTGANDWALRMADAATASDLTTAYQGGLPKPVVNLGGIALGIGGDGANGSFGTFYEGAVVAGFPAPEIDLAILKNVQAVGYAK